MAATVHLFEDMMATYHSLGIAGEVAGKSSNTRWAFRQQSKICGVKLPQRRLSSVFITVGDPDTTRHPQLTFRFVDHLALISVSCLVPGVRRYAQRSPWTSLAVLLR